MNTRQKIITQIRQERRIQNLSQKEMGERMIPPVSPQRVGMIERCPKGISLEVIVRMLDALGLELTIRKK